MGLDQIAYATPADKPLTVDPEDSQHLWTPIAMWRKHNRLHGWMEKLWESKGRPNWDGEKSPLGDFNQIPLELTWTDLEQLEAHVLNKTLPQTEGFHFGADSFEERQTWASYTLARKPPTKEGYYYKETDLVFIANARKALQEGQRVVYDSWW